MYWTVEVFDSDGDPMVGVEVITSFTSMWRGQLEAFTDSSGHASFGFDDCDEGEAKIYVRGQSFGPYYIRDGEGYTVNLD